MGSRPDLGHRAGDPGGLQPGELERQRLALWRDEQESLAAVVGALALHHVPLVDQLLEHAPERLFGDLQNHQQVRNLDAGIAVDEVEHPMMGAAEAEFSEHVVGVTDKVAVSEEQEFDNVPDRLVRPVRGIGGAGRALRR